MAHAQPNTITRDWKVIFAALLMVIAGIIHFIVIPDQWRHAPAHGLTMGIIGALEVAWAVLYWIKPTPRMAKLGVVLAISMVALWAITRFAPAPYTMKVEEVDLPGILTKICEGVCAAALLAIVVSVAPWAGPRRSAWQIVIPIVLVSVLVAAAAYEVAWATQPLFPQLSPPATEPMDMPNPD